MKSLVIKSENIIGHIWSLLIIGGVIAIYIIGMVFWQLYQHDKTNEMTINYYDASYQKLNAIRYEVLKIQIEINKGHVAPVLPSLHIINKRYSELISIQEKYQQPHINRALTQLRSELSPLLAIIDAQQNMQQRIHLENIKAVLLTLKQLGRLHAINNKALTDKTIKEETTRVTIMLGILLILILVGAFFTRKTFNTIKRIIKNEKDGAAKLAKEKERIQITLDSIGDAVITTDTGGRVVSMNPVAEKLSGWSFSDAVGKSLKSILPIIDATNRTPIDNPVDKVLATGKTVYLSNHTTLIAKDNKEYQIADSAAAIRDNDGEIQGVVLVFNDVTEQYLLRQAADKSKRDLQAILDHTPAVVYVKNLHGCFTFVNQKFESLFHIKSADIIGKTLHDVFSKDIADEMQMHDEKALKEGYALEYEEIATHANSSHIFSAIKFPLFNNENKIYAVCGVLTDISMRKQQDENLRRSQKMDALGKLTGGIAHDYNNMLGVILGYAEILESMLGDKPKLIDFVKEITHAGERGTKLTKKLLSFSKQKTSDSTVLNLSDVLKEEQHMLEKTLTARIKLNLDLADDVWPVSIDMGEFEDAIVNISINAMHAIEGIGEYTIHLRNETLNEMDAAVLQVSPGDYVLLSMTDTGSGMDEQTREKIFEPFFSTKGELGTGLGLSQVYGFIERCNGAIKVYSEEGLGTRITLYFPRYLGEITDKDLEGDAEFSELTNTMSGEDLRGNETILIVDDEIALRRLASEILGSQGYQVLSAENGKQALEILENERVDLLFSDVIMPEMDGYELVAIVKEKYPSMKIQLASGFSDNRHVGRNDEILHNNLLQKPYHSARLLKRLRELLD